MKISLYVVCAAAFLTSGAVVADEDTNESTPIELSAAQMDQITAGSLELPNDNVVQSDFDNPSPGDFHPALTKRALAALAATTGNGPSVQEEGNEGPWSATIASPVITCVGAEVIGSMTGNTNCVP